MKTKKAARRKILTKAIPMCDWMNRPDYKKENREWIRKSVNVALRVLDALDEKKMSQSGLAEKLGVNRQKVSKIVKGQENLTLETITKLEQALGIKLVYVIDEEK